MSFLDHAIAIIIIWLTVTAQPDNTRNCLVILRNNQDDALNLYDFTKKLRPISKSGIVTIIYGRANPICFYQLPCICWRAREGSGPDFAGFWTAPAPRAHTPRLLVKRNNGEKYKIIKTIWIFMISLRNCIVSPRPEAFGFGVRRPIMLTIIIKITRGILGKIADSFPPPGSIRFWGKAADNAHNNAENNPGNPGKNCR